MTSWPNIKLGRYYLLQFGLSTLTWPQNTMFVLIFSITYLHLPLFTYIWLNVALITLIWSYFPLIALIWPYVPHSSQIDILLLKLHLRAKFESNRTIIHVDIAFKSIRGYKKGCHECSLCVYLVIDVCTFWCFTPFSNFKAIGQLVMEILHLKDFGDTASVVTNAVVLEFGECHISIPTYIWGISTLL